jgi:hypothetical protein
MDALIQHAGIEDSYRSQDNHHKDIIRPFDHFETIEQPPIELFDWMLEENREKNLYKKLQNVNHLITPYIHIWTACPYVISMPDLRPASVALADV